MWFTCFIFSVTLSAWIDKNLHILIQYPPITIIINTVARFSTRVNSSCSTGIGVNPHQYDLLGYFSGAVMACNQIWSHEREPE